MIFKRQLSRYGPGVVLVIAALLLFLAQSAYWVNHTVFNQANFSRITTTSLLSESSRESIATSIVNKSLENRPILQKTVGKRAISVTSGLLGSDLSTQAVEALSDKTYAYTTSKNRKDIKIDLTAIKTPLSKIVSLVQDDDSKAVSIQTQIPDEIVLVRSDAFPNLSGTAQMMLWLGPLLWLSVIVLFGLYIYSGRANYANRVYRAGLAVIIVASLGLFTAPFIPPPIAAAVPNIELRPVAENLAAGFLAPFKSQMVYMLGCTLIVLVIFNQRYNLLSALKSLETKLSNRPIKKPTR